MLNEMDDSGWNGGCTKSGKELTVPKLFDPQAIANSRAITSIF